MWCIIFTNMQNLLKGKKLVFIFNVRHKYPDPKNPSTFVETDFDDQETIDTFIKHLEGLGFDVLPVESNNDAEKILRTEKENIGFVLNYSEVVLGSSPKIYMAEILEKLGLPFSGCSNEVQKLIIDKGKMKTALLLKGVSTLPFQVIKNVEEKLKKELYYPLIVKPIAQGSSAGITNKSVVNNVDELKRQIKFILDTFHEPALIEPFIVGREFSVGILGNPPEFLPIVEPRHDKLPEGFYHIDSLEVKWEFEEELGVDYFECPAKIDEALKNRVEKTCLDAWNTLEIRDFCRIDLRMDKKGNLFVLDVNSPPGLIPPEISTTSYLPMAAKIKGVSYDELLTKIIDIGLKRQNG